MAAFCAATSSFQLSSFSSNMLLKRPLMGFTVERRAHGTGDCCTKPRQEVRSRRNGMVVFMKPNSLDTTTLTTCVYRLFVTPPVDRRFNSPRRKDQPTLLCIFALCFFERVWFVSSPVGVPRAHRQPRLDDHGLGRVLHYSLLQPLLVLPWR